MAFLIKEATAVRLFLVEQFNEGEIRTLCADLGINFDSLGGGLGLEDKCRELVALATRISREQTLLEYIEANRQTAFRENSNLSKLKERMALEEHTLSAAMAFVNRGYELDQICKPTAVDRIIIDAPAGYGKSYLLLEVKRHFGAKGDWQCVLIKADENVVNQAAIVNQIARQMSSYDLSFLHSLDESLETLSGILQASRRHLLILIDDLHHWPQEIIEWTIGSLIEVIQKNLTAESKPHIRFIASGRYINPSRMLYKRFQHLQLTPFDEQVVREAVLARAGQQGVSLTGTIIAEIVDEVLNISGGHPWCINQILNELAQKNFALQPRQHFKAQRELFLAHLSEAIAGILKEIGDLAEPLSILSVFRRFDRNILDVLKNRGYLAPDTDTMELLTRLIKTHLITLPGASQMYSDRLVRRMLCIKMRLEPPTVSKYWQLNQLAMEIFDKWVRGLDLAGKRLPKQLIGKYQVVAVLDALYHFTNSLADLEANEAKIQVLARWQEYVHLVGKAPGGFESLYELESGFLGDWELQKLMRDKAGEDCLDAARTLITRNLESITGPGRV